MPYHDISDLPKAQTDQSGPHQKEAFLKAFNKAYEKKNMVTKEPSAFAVAHHAAKQAGERNHGALAWLQAVLTQGGPTSDRTFDAIGEAIGASITAAALTGCASRRPITRTRLRFALGTLPFVRIELFLRARRRLPCLLRFTSGLHGGGGATVGRHRTRPPKPDTLRVGASVWAPVRERMAAVARLFVG